VGQALLVRQWSADVVFFPHTLELAGDERERLTARGVGIVDGVIKRLVVDGDGLRAVELGTPSETGPAAPCALGRTPGGAAR
jgi:hypothetical protein